ncbi:MAG: class II aldolase/adducin family protein [Bacteroidota bacterium]
MDEGYIKFDCQWKKGAVWPVEKVEALAYWRQRMYEVGLIGAYADGIGFGNISQRLAEGLLMISGSATGLLKALDGRHFARVSNIDIAANRVICEGPIRASSETMSHAVIYLECPWVNAVIHVHHLALWQKHLDQLPTTLATASYGTPQMAYEIIRLLQETAVQERKVFVMGGHREGLIAFGADLEEAGELLLDLLSQL